VCNLTVVFIVMEQHVVSYGSARALAQTCPETAFQPSEPEIGDRWDVADGRMDELDKMRDSNSSSALLEQDDELLNPLELVRGLLECRVDVVDAVQLAKQYYEAAGARSEPVSTVSSQVSVASAKKAQRLQVWHERMAAMPRVSGQCYLLPVRWGRRNAFRAALGLSPTFRDFVAFLKPGDLDLAVAGRASLYRMRVPGTPGLRVVYHVADDGEEVEFGERVGSVIECVSCLLRLYPFVNGEYVCDVPGVDVMPVVGVVGIDVTLAGDAVSERFSRVAFGELSSCASRERDEIASGYFRDTQVAALDALLDSIALVVGVELTDVAVLSLDAVSNSKFGPRDKSTTVVVKGDRVVSRTVHISAASVVQVRKGCRVHTESAVVDFVRFGGLLICEPGVRFTLEPMDSDQLEGFPRVVSANYWLRQRIPWGSLFHGSVSKLRLFAVPVLACSDAPIFSRASLRKVWVNRAAGHSAVELVVPDSSCVFSAAVALERGSACFKVGGFVTTSTVNATVSLVRTSFLRSVSVRVAREFSVPVAVAEEFKSSELVVMSGDDLLFEDFHHQMYVQSSEDDMD